MHDFSEAMIVECNQMDSESEWSWSFNLPESFEEK